ncbi:hypothetical protein QAD02_002156 [Eretmocerus hayati]|uniref:Uncharacterized protein n=1 Tax=Eretmocerus hayati TaxID=131215 RepID=A0ACC2NIG5_9HYME|nr:hypothetical protein QAD02_002156 [Eretmocerus hayati]
MVLPDTQLRFMVDYLLDHEEMAKGHITLLGPQGEETYHQLWEHLLDEVNNAGPVQVVSVQKLKKIWDDARSDAKANVRDFDKDLGKIGNKQISVILESINDDICRLFNNFDLPEFENEYSRFHKPGALSSHEQEKNCRSGRLTQNEKLKIINFIEKNQHYLNGVILFSKDLSEKQEWVDFCKSIHRKCDETAKSWCRMRDEVSRIMNKSETKFSPLSDTNLKIAELHEPGYTQKMKLAAASDCKNEVKDESMIFVKNETSLKRSSSSSVKSEETYECQGKKTKTETNDSGASQEKNHDDGNFGNVEELDFLNLKDNHSLINEIQELSQGCKSRKLFNRCAEEVVSYYKQKLHLKAKAENAHSLEDDDDLTRRSDQSLATLSKILDEIVAMKQENKEFKGALIEILTKIFDLLPTVFPGKDYAAGAVAQRINASAQIMDDEPIEMGTGVCIVATISSDHGTFVRSLVAQDPRTIAV